MPPARIFATLLTGCLKGRLGRLFYCLDPESLVASDKRPMVTLACTECKRRNYNTTKNKINHRDRLELKKHCPWCRKHTLHRETR